MAVMMLESFPLFDNVLATTIGNGMDCEANPGLPQFSESFLCSEGVKDVQIGKARKGNTSTMRRGIIEEIR